jgi:hypothetical protein
MTLDLILFRPEFFFIFSFFVLLWYGTGNLVTPVAEILTVSTVHSSGAASNAPALQHEMRSRLNNDKGHRFADRPSLSTGQSPGYSTNRTRGPNHAVTGLTAWAVVWCILCF